ncbi:MAG: putative phosphotransferase enzyme family, partial [Bacilli bacterium]|nr:putative phosphotransferase enzyme family [Bacilli bacterium]
ISCIENLIGRLKLLPKDKDSYGLVHSDLHQKNFFVQNGSITAFDFDDAGYHFFISDISIILYSAICYPAKKSDDQSEFAKLFFHHFMEGYHSENRLDSFWYDTIPDFIRMRHALALVTFYQISNISALKENQLEMLEQHHFEVENRMPAFPFESLR